MPEDTKPEAEKPVVWSTSGGHVTSGRDDSDSEADSDAVNPSTHHGDGLTYAAMKKLVAISLIVGLVGGGAGAWGYVRFFGGEEQVARQQLTVQESSAVIDVAKKVSPSVVSITSKSVGQSYFGQPVEQQGAGTGIIVSADGLILTNKHVVSEANATYTVVTSTGKEYPAKVLARDTINDIAFVKVSAKGLPAATIGDSGAVQIGQKVVAIGNALGQFQNTVTEGIISGVGRPVTAGDSSSGGSLETLSNMFQTDAAINPGNSGGPLLNLDGQVIGMNTAVAGQDSQNIGFAIPINETKPLIASVKSKGVIVRPYLGVRYVQLTKQIADANNLKVSAGAWLQGDAANPAVLADSPAAKAGLRDGDVVTKIGNDVIGETTSPQALVAKHSAGDKVTVTYVRDGKTQTTTVTLGTAPPAE